MSITPTEHNGTCRNDRLTLAPRWRGRWQTRRTNRPARCIRSAGPRVQRRGTSWVCGRLRWGMVWWCSSRHCRLSKMFLLDHWQTIFCSLPTGWPCEPSPRARGRCCRSSNDTRRRTAVEMSCSPSELFLRSLRLAGLLGGPLAELVNNLHGSMHHYY